MLRPPSEVPPEARPDGAGSGRGHSLPLAVGALPVVGAETSESIPEIEEGEAEAEKSDPLWEPPRWEVPSRHTYTAPSPHPTPPL